MDKTIKEITSQRISLDRSIISTSALDAWISCPCLFKASRLDIVKIPSSDAQLRGIAIHKEIELASPNKMRPAKYSRLWQIITRNVRNEVRIEKRVAGIPYPIVGIVDIWPDDNGRIIDIKTSSKKPTPSWWATRLISNQSAMYAFLTDVWTFGIFAADYNEYQELEVKYGSWQLLLRRITEFSQWLSSEQPPIQRSSWKCRGCPLNGHCEEGGSN